MIARRDEELVSTPSDKHGVRQGAALPRHKDARERGRGEEPRAPATWSWHQTHEVGGVWGAFPQRFLTWALEQLGVAHTGRMLHVCSGGIGPQDRAVRVDLRPLVQPDIVADGRSLPIKSESFDAVLLDPPYSLEYAETLYGTDYPRPSHLLREAARVVKPGGRIGFVHFLVPNPPEGTRLQRVIGLTQGCGYRIRALCIYAKEPQGLFEGAAELAPLQRTDIATKRVAKRAPIDRRTT